MEAEHSCPIGRSVAGGRTCCGTGEPTGTGLLEVTAVGDGDGDGLLTVTVGLGVASCVATGCDDEQAIIRARGRAATSSFI
jgi:hypothetical protein